MCVTRAPHLAIVSRLVRVAENGRKTPGAAARYVSYVANVDRQLADMSHVTCRRFARYTCTLVLYASRGKRCRSRRGPYHVDVSFQLFIQPELLADIFFSFFFAFFNAKSQQTQNSSQRVSVIHLWE